MMKDSCLYCYFPTTAVMVDDNEQFLAALRLKMVGCEPTKLYASPIQALDFVRNAYQPFRTYSDLSELHKLVFDPKRSETISVVVVDYAMPEMNGVEFCRKIADLPVKKILLTGEADHKIAVEAFNEGIIDKFIRKDEEPLDLIMSGAIAKAKFDYLIELSSNTLSYRYPASKVDGIPEYERLLAGTHFITQGISESYLLDTNGSLFMICSDDTPYWLIIRTDEQLQFFKETATDSEAPASIIKQIKTKKQCPLLLTEDEQYLHPSFWKGYMYPIQSINYWPGYYYALIKGEKGQWSLSDSKELISCDVYAGRLQRDKSYFGVYSAIEPYSLHQ